MKVSISKAIKMAKDNKDLSEITIENLADIQVDAIDALALARQGLLIPEENIHYDDQKIAYDEDIDEVDWSASPVQLTFEEKVDLAKQIKRKSSKKVQLTLGIEDPKLSEWIHLNKNKINELISNLLTDLYQTQKVIKE